MPQRNMTRLEKKVVMTILMKKMYESLLATILKNLLWVPYNSLLAQALIRIPSMELKIATTVATSRLSMVDVATCEFSDSLLIHSLSASMVRNAINISTPVPTNNHTLLFSSFSLPIFSQMISLGSVKCSKSVPCTSDSLTGYSKKTMTLPAKLLLDYKVEMRVLWVSGGED